MGLCNLFFIHSGRKKSMFQLLDNFENINKKLKNKQQKLVDEVCCVFTECFDLYKEKHTVYCFKDRTARQGTRTEI